MPDLKLNLLTHDMDVTGGVASLTNDFNGETTAQLIAIALKNFLGEWFLDNRIGVDYLGVAFKKNFDPGSFEAMVRATIMGVVGVQQITAYSQTFVSVTRTMNVTWSVIDELGNILSSTTGVSS
jgi:hypothetical protein